MIGNTLVSLALLKSNWDVFRKDYLENFVPFVVEIARNYCQKTFVSVDTVQEKLRSDFGLEIPLQVIKSLLIRSAKRGFLETENRVYFPSRKCLESSDFQAKQESSRERYRTLISELFGFGRKMIPDLEELEIESALISYINSNFMMILNAENSGTIFPEPRSTTQKFRFVVASFIKHISTYNNELFNYLVEITKGLMLANSVFLPNPQDAQRKFKNTAIFLDTPFILNALGYNGSVWSKSPKELLEILRETEADICCFEHTVREIEGILYSCALKIGSSQDMHGYGRVMREFAKRGYTDSDVRLRMNRIEEDLTKLQVLCTPKPEYLAEFMIDEKELKKHIENAIKYHDDRALNNDLDSIISIEQLRKGHLSRFVEDSRALFITTNVELAKETNHFFYESNDRAMIPPCLTSYSLMNLLWLKKALAEPDLPKEQLISNCYAALLPSEGLWRTFQVNIEKLRKDEALSDQDYFLLRSSLSSEEYLMNVTLGDEEAITEGSVMDILERIKAEILEAQDQKNLQALDKLSREKEKAEAEKDESALKYRTLRKSMEEKADKSARKLSRVLYVMILVLAIFATFVTILFATENVWYLLASVISAVFEVYELLSKKLFNGLYLRVRRSKVSKLCRDLGIDESELID